MTSPSIVKQQHRVLLTVSFTGAHISPDALAAYLIRPALKAALPDALVNYAVRRDTGDPAPSSINQSVQVCAQLDLDLTVTGVPIGTEALARHVVAPAAARALAHLAPDRVHVAGVPSDLTGDAT